MLNCSEQHFSNSGYCVICECKCTFTAHQAWLRDYYRCGKCNSIPRQRALIYALNTYVPEYRSLKIHESSPAGPSSDFLEKKCTDYSVSFYYPTHEPGSIVNGYRCENLEALTFSDETFDIIITQDVLEHVMQPGKVFSEICRVLKKGGYHIFSVPWYPQIKQSIKRAKLINKEIKHLAEPVYHGNPIDSKGSLVTYDWGEDLLDIIKRESNMTTTVLLRKDRNLGLDGELLHIFISKK